MNVITRRRFTVDEYRKMAETGILAQDDRVELIEGEVVDMSPIGAAHASVVLRLTRLLVRLAGDHASVAVQSPVDLDAYAQPQPYLTLLRPRGDDYASQLPRAGDVLLAIEVADSSLAYDRDVKMPLYGRSGIPEAWLIDVRGSGGVEIHRCPTARGYRELVRPQPGGVLAVPGLAGLFVAVDDLLQR